jgi:hypothetical protein
VKFAKRLCRAESAKLVETGLDLLDFPTISFYESGYSLHTLRQASRRSLRIGQRRPVRVKFLCSEGTMHTSCLRLMGKKLLVALTMEGKVAGEGLQSIDEDDDMLSAMARELVERNGIGDTADSVWRALSTEHQKLFPGSSHSDDDGASIEMPDTQPNPASLVEEAMDTASVVVFRQRPDSLARKRRARPVVPEQASLFSLSQIRQNKPGAPRHLFGPGKSWHGDESLGVSPKELEMFAPNLSILPESQRQLWAEFVLYGGTALALRLGHRQSEAFDFFSNVSFQAHSLRDRLPYLKHAEMTQFQDNTLTAVVDRNGPVKLSFFGSLGIKRVQDPDVVEENGVQVASMLDLLASKLKTVQLRAQEKDYRDVLGTLDAGLSLAEGLAAAAIYGKDFNGALSLKALTFFEDGDLPSLTRTVQKRLLEAATSVNLRELPAVVARSGLSRQEAE